MGAKCLGFLLTQSTKGSLFSMLHLCSPWRHQWCQYLPRLSTGRAGCWEEKNKAAPLLCSNSRVDTRWHLCNVSVFGQQFCLSHLQGQRLSDFCAKHSRHHCIFCMEEASLGFGTSHKLNVLAGTSSKQDLRRGFLRYFAFCYQSVIPW